MSTILDIDSSKNEYGYGKRLHVKGASEIILKTCTKYVASDGSVKDFDDAMKSSIENNVIERFASGALRTIAFAYKDLKENDGGPDHDDKEDGAKIHKIEEDGLTLVCIAGIADIIKEEVEAAVAKCGTAHVTVRMITGDNITTAIAIAKQCNIIPKDGDPEKTHKFTCLEGPEFFDIVGGLVNKKTREPIKKFGEKGVEEVVGNLQNMIEI